MLQKIRDGASGPLAYIVVGVIALVFGVWGIGSYFTPSSDPVVASAAGTDIKHSQLQNAFDQRYQRIRQMFGKNFDPDLMPPDQIRRNVLNGLIDQAVMQAHAQDAGYRVTDANLLAQIRSNPQFQDDGKFSPQRYRALLAQANIAPAQYEAGMRQSLLSQQVQQVLIAGAFAAPAEVDQAYKRANQQRNTQYLVFDANAYKQGVNVSSAQVQQYYDKHADQFQRPQRVKLSYVSLDNGSVSVAAPDEQALRSLYDQHQDELGTPETRSLDVVSVAIDDNNDASARETIQAIAAAVKKGDSLEQAAKATDGARFQSMTSQPQKNLPSALAAPAFGLDKGALSNPVRGDQAWYLARVTAVTPAKTPSFDAPEVQAQLKAMATQEATAQAYKKKAKQLDDLAYQAPNDLKTIADQLGLTIQHSDWINAQGGPGLGQYDAVRKAAFSDAVLKDKLNSEVIDLGDQRKVVLRVADKQPAQQKPLDEVRDDIQQRLVVQQAGTQARDAADAALKAVNGGESLTAVAKADSNASLKTPGFVGRTSNEVDPRVLETAFAMPLPGAKGGDSKPSYRVTGTSTGNVALVAVTGARDSAANDKQQAKQQRAQFAEQQSQSNVQLEYAALDNYLRDQADVDIQKDALK